MPTITVKNIDSNTVRPGEKFAMECLPTRVPFYKKMHVNQYDVRNNERKYCSIESILIRSCVSVSRFRAVTQ